MRRVAILFRWFLSLLVAALAAADLTAQSTIPVTGVTDKTVYDDRVTLRVPAESGYLYAVTLNGIPLATDVSKTLTDPDFYELWVTRTPVSPAGSPLTQLTRFIIAASERKGTEWGLPAHLPGPSIPSSSDEFAGGNLRVLLPERVPSGVAVPAVAWVENDAGHALRVNGWVSSDGQETFQLHRGVGAGWFVSNASAGPIEATFSVGGLSVTRHMTVETNVPWISVAGILPKQTQWPESSRILITGALTVPAGGELVVGAGNIVLIQSGLNITNNGNLRILGSRERPVLFAPAVSNRPWGGIIMRSGTGDVEGQGVLFTGSGSDPAWFGAAGNPSSHRREQALFFVNDTQRVHLTDSAAVFLAGQFGHAVKGGTFEFDHFLMQRTTSGGEFTGTRFTVRDSAFIECPDDAPTFEDGDNDALYLVSGIHSFSDTLIGWTRDDGIDSGGSGYGLLSYERCWFEATFHEGNSLSGYKNTVAHDTVYFDCGQGIEAGYDSPTGRVDHCLFIGCESGVRHGDNYANIGSYAGTLIATNCLILNNHRDVFGHNWRSTGWTNATGQMKIQNNWLTAQNPYFPSNKTWSPSGDGARLGEFGARSRVGVGLAVRPGVAWSSGFPAGVPLGLSSFCTEAVEVQLLLEQGDGRETFLTHRFEPGQVRGVVSLPSDLKGTFRLSLVAAIQAQMTGITTVLAQRSELTSGDVTLVERASVWKYRDDGADLGTAWKDPDYADGTWTAGPGTFGYGDGAEGTVLRPTDVTPTGPITYYFRRSFQVPDPSLFQSLTFAVRRDDGLRVFLNGAESFRMNLPEVGSITNKTLASVTVSGADELAYFSTNRPAALLKSGANTLAVDLHQSATTSGDAHFDLELIGVKAKSLPALRLGRFRQGWVLSWDGTAVLWESDRVDAGWRRSAVGGSPVEIAADSGSRFYRLAAP